MYQRYIKGMICDASYLSTSLYFTKKKKKFWLCGLIISEEDCVEILEPCSSRFFDDGFFTRTMFTTVEPIGRFMYPFENMRQVNLVLKIMRIYN
jgi:hypothetical protein